MMNTSYISSKPAAISASHPNQHPFHVESIPRRILRLLLPFHKYETTGEPFIRTVSTARNSPALPSVPTPSSQTWAPCTDEDILCKLSSRKSRSTTGRKPSRGTTTTIPKAPTSSTAGFAPPAVRPSSSAMKRTNSVLFVPERWMA